MLLVNTQTVNAHLVQITVINAKNGGIIRRLGLYIVSYLPPDKYSIDTPSLSIYIASGKVTHANKQFPFIEYTYISDPLYEVMYSFIDDSSYKRIKPITTLLSILPPMLFNIPCQL